MIIFLHGWGADKSSFLWLKNYFDDYSLVFVDFPGFGESAEPNKNFYLSDYVNELKDVLDKFDVKELILVGHSFGGRVAIKFCFLYQNDYKRVRLCLVDSAGILPRRGLGYYFKIYKYKRCKKKALNLRKYQEKLSKFGSNDYKLLSERMKQIFVHIVNEDLSMYAKYINSETLIVWGEKDKDTPIYMAKKLKRLIKNSELKIIENAGHFSFIDNKDEFLILLDTFLKN